MELVVVVVGLEVVDGLLPVCRQNVLVLPLKPLVDVGPCACVQLRWRISGLSELFATMSV